MDKKYKAETVFPSFSIYLFVAIFISVLIIFIYSLMYTLPQERSIEETSWFVFLLFVSGISIYVFGRYPRWIEISENDFIPLIPQRLANFITRKIQRVNYDDIFRVKLFRMDGKTFRIDLELINGNSLMMHFLERNPELAKAYEKVFKMKIDEKILTVIEKHSKKNE